MLANTIAYFSQSLSLTFHTIYSSSSISSSRRSSTYKINITIMSSAERPRRDRAPVSYKEDNDAAIAAALTEEDEKAEVRPEVSMELY